MKLEIKVIDRLKKIVTESVNIAKVKLNGKT
jgi:hypothetical protein